jgi:hypothetical protein
MAILVSNPSTVQFTGAPAEPQDPAANPLDTGFTEELANAMQPSDQKNEGGAAGEKPVAPLVDTKLNGLQILPADVLLNAVGEANFAFVAQGAQALQDGATSQILIEGVTETPLLETLDATQAAEMAAAALAAQMATQVAGVEVQAPPSTAANSLNAVGAVGGVENANVLQASVVLTGNTALPDATLPTAQTTQNLMLPESNLQAGATGVALAPTASNSVQNLNQLNQGSQAEVTQLADSKPVAIDASTLVAVVQTATPSQVTSSSATQEKSALGQAQPVEISGVSNQASGSMLSNGQLSAEAVQVESSSTLLAPAESVLAKPQALITEGGNAVANSSAASIPTVALNSEASASAGPISDVARPGDVGSANPAQAGNANQLIEATQLPANGTSGATPQENVQFNPQGSDDLSGIQTQPLLSDLKSQPMPVAEAELNQETSFKFDAKLGASLPNEAVALKAKLLTPVSLGGIEGAAVPVSLSAPAPINGTVVQNQVVVSTDAVVVSKVQSFADGNEVVLESEVQTTTITSTVGQAGITPVIQKSAATSSRIQTVNSTEGLVASRQANAESEVTLDDEILSEMAEELDVKPLGSVATASGASASRLSQSSSDSASANEGDMQNGFATAGLSTQQVAAENAQSSVAQTESVQPAAKGFSDVSSTFVSTLVGGPQRPITTVMDWVALKPQEPPRPVVPHELRLDAGAVQVEIQRMVKQGGGHVVMELTPPDQSKFTIELKLDDKGGAFLRVEGVSDSTKTRLEQSAPQLQEQFQEMGLNLQLDMRQNRDSSSSAASEWVGNESESINGQPQEATPQATRAVAAERARKNNGGQVYLYA